MNLLKTIGAIILSYIVCVVVVDIAGALLITILPEPDALDQEIVDIFQPHPPSFRWTQSDPFNGGVVNLMKSDPKIPVSLRPTDLIHCVAIQFRPAEPQNMNVLIAQVVANIRMEVPEHVVRYLVSHEQSGTL